MGLTASKQAQSSEPGEDSDRRGLKRARSEDGSRDDALRRRNDDYIKVLRAEASALRATLSVDMENKLDEAEEKFEFSCEERVKALRAAIENDFASKWRHAENALASREAEAARTLAAQQGKLEATFAARMKEVEAALKEAQEALRRASGKQRAASAAPAAVMAAAMAEDGATSTEENDEEESTSSGGGGSSGGGHEEARGGGDGSFSDLVEKAGAALAGKARQHVLATIRCAVKEEDCATVLAALKRNPLDAKINERGWNAVGSLCMTGRNAHAAHRQQLGACGACELLTTVLRTLGGSGASGGTTRSASNPGLLAAALGTLGGSGGSSGIGGNAALVAESLRAIIYLAFGSETNSSRFIAAGVPDLLAAALRGFPEHARVQNYGCLAVNNLAYFREEHKKRLGTAGICEAVVAGMAVQPGNAHVLAAACFAIEKLAGNGANRDRLNAAGATAAVREAVAGHPANSELAVAAKLALTNLRVT